MMKPEYRSGAPMPAFTWHFFRFCCTSLLFLATCGLHAQEQVVWARALENAEPVYDGTRTHSIAVDPWGNVALAGSCVPDVILNGDTASIVLPYDTLGNQTLLVRYRANGEPAWGYRMGGENTDFGDGVAVDNEGSIYLCAVYHAAFDADPTAGVDSIQPVSSYMNVYVAKFDSAGNYLFVRRMGTTQGLPEGFSMAVDAQDNLYLGGSFNGNLHLDDGVGQTVIPGSLPQGRGIVLKYDADGNLLHVMQLIGSASAEVEDLVVRPDGSFLLAGSFQSTIDIDPDAGTQTLTGNSSSDMFVSYDADFHPRWGIVLGTLDGLQSQHICEGTDGGVIVCGAYSNTMVVPFADGSTQTFNSSSPALENYIAALDSTGGVLWLRSFPIGAPGQPIAGLVALADGSVLAQLQYTEINVDPGVTDLTFTTNGFPEYNMAFARYRMTDGALVEAHAFDGYGNNLLEVAAYGSSFYLNCFFGAPLNVDLAGGQHIVSPAGGALVRYCQPPVLSTSAHTDTLVLCAEQDTLLTAFGAEQYTWYLQAEGGEPIATGSELVITGSLDTLTYYLEGVDTLCTSPRLPITCSPAPPLA
ncbi:MAG: hypothetical protein IPO90_04395 [Flavobacteriales bacterium]|nr:hypothetical protein [Flavobacteriales bacterium]